MGAAPFARQAVGAGLALFMLALTISIVGRAENLEVMGGKRRVFGGVNRNS
jgi:hypothetical protein